MELCGLAAYSFGISISDNGEMHELKGHRRSGSLRVGAALAACGALLAAASCSSSGGQSGDGSVTKQCTEAAQPGTLFTSCIDPGSSSCFGHYLEQLAGSNCRPVTIHEVEGEVRCVTVGEYRCSLSDGNVFHAFVSFEWGTSADGAAVQAICLDVDILDRAGEEVCRGTEQDTLTTKNVPPGCAGAVRGDCSYAAEVRSRLEDPATGRPVVEAFDFDVIDAAYSRSLERLLVLSSSPKAALQIVDPNDGTATEVALTATPSRVVVDPSGKWALVGHDAQVTLVELAAAAVSKTLAVDFAVRDLAMASRDLAYAVPAEGRMFDLRGLDLQTEDMVHLGSLEEFGIGLSHADLSPDGTKLAAIPAGFEPLEVWVYDVKSRARVQAFELPGFVAERAYYPGRGRFAFFNSAGDVLYVIVEAEGSDTFGLTQLR